MTALPEVACIVCGQPLDREAVQQDDDRCTSCWRGVVAVTDVTPSLPSDTVTGATGPDVGMSEYVLPGGRVVALSRSMFVPAGDFLRATSTGPEPVWGDGAEVLWSRGEPALVTGPVGVGKTTVLARLMRASVGLQDRLLGFPVTQAERVLYLACDRPEQIGRNLARSFTDSDYDVLNKRGNIWRGPPPADLAANPPLLREITKIAGLRPGDRLFIDGLKDVAVGLASDEAGAGLNQALQYVVAAGVDVVANHHQRKAGGGANGGKPKSINDVYGSMFITAGAGTVLLVWADRPGASHITVETLKPAAEHVGPLDVLHDFDTGDLTVGTVDSVLDVLARGKHTTFSVGDLCRGLGRDGSDKNERDRVRRAVEREVTAGRASFTEHQRPGGGRAERFYRWVGGPS